MLIVVQFVRVFCLSLSVLKFAAFWGIVPAALAPLQQEFGIPCTISLEALVATWHMINKAALPCAKQDQESRADKVRGRLLRVCHLPAHPALRASVVSTAALSIVDYLSPPSKRVMHACPQANGEKSHRPYVRCTGNHLQCASFIMLGSSLTEVFSPCSDFG